MALGLSCFSVGGGVVVMMVVLAMTEGEGAVGGADEGVGVTVVAVVAVLAVVLVVVLEPLAEEVTERVLCGGATSLTTLYHPFAGIKKKQIPKNQGCLESCL